MKIACLIPGGLGGTQKAGWLFAAGLAQQGHEVVGFSKEGPFVPSSPTAGLSVETIPEEKAAFPAIAAGRFDALHIHMPGYYIRHPLYPFLKSLGTKRPRVVETNVFGWLQDWRANSTTDYRLFISMTSACQAATRAGKPLSTLKNCNVARYPVAEAPFFSSEEREMIRQEFGWEKDDVVALRLGRPDPAKWTDLECLATMHAGGTQKNLKLLVIEPPSDLKRRISSGEFGNGVFFHPMENSACRVAALVNACDIVFHAARFGESFGYAIAEGMAAAKPIITQSTPWGDNAQVELVEHGVTGYVCCSLEGMVCALRKLAEDNALRETMGQVAKRRILALGNPKHEGRILEAALQNNREILDVRWKEVLAYDKSFPANEWNVFEKTHPACLPDSGKILRREMHRARLKQLRKYFSSIRANARSLVGQNAYK